MTKLLIVESPGKTKKVQAFLGTDFRVMASVGHVRDLPVKEIGVKSPDFKPDYKPTDRGKKVIADLKKVADKADQVFLATDPDREGEAIAWHLKEALKLKNPLRVTYAEITEKAVKEALKAPRQIDENLVKAQEARRVLDRLVGYQVSPVLSNLIGGQLSAGRVQSPALKLVVEREKAILSFQETVHYGVDLFFENDWKASWLPKEGWFSKDDEYFQDKGQAELISQIKEVKVTNYAEKDSQSAPSAPFTTSSLQQAASVTLKLSPKKTMEIAQKLYEGGHITYMRTDSPNLSNEAIEDIRQLAAANSWPLPDKARTWKSKEGAQEAHEAIRPTHLDVEKAGDNDEQAALYNLIRLRAIASQLEVAAYADAVALFEADLEGRKVVFEAKGRRMTSPGWRVLMPNGDQTNENAEDDENQIPKLTAGENLKALKGAVVTKKTKPPTRFSEASLIKELENRGIGRPSTYAAILDNISSRAYVQLDNKKRLEPTGLGLAIIEALSDKFLFLDYEFTKNLENDLDLIAEGKKKYLDVVSGVNGQLESELSKFVTVTAYPCPECQKPLRHVVKAGVYDFWGCTGYPDCKATYANDSGKPGERQASKGANQVSEYKCPECGSFLVRRTGNKSGKTYDFYGCLGFPNCKALFQTKDDKPVFK